MGERKGSGFLNAYNRKSYKNSDRRYTKDPQNEVQVSSISQISSQMNRVQNQNRNQPQTDDYITEEEIFRSRRINNRQPDENIYAKESRQREAKSVLNNEFYSRKPFNYKSFGAK